MPSRYTGSIQTTHRLETKEGERNNNPYPYLEPSHSKKLTKEKGLKTINTLTQDQRLHTKECFSFWSESTSFPKANKFLTFQTNQNIHKGAICHAFLRVFPTNAPCHPRRVSLTEPKRTQATPKREKRRFHNACVLTPMRNEEYIGCINKIFARTSKWPGSYIGIALSRADKKFLQFPHTIKQNLLCI